MQIHTICHCGKCKIRCNKHGKRAKCADCGKIRLLGTVVKDGNMRHICNECCIKIEEQQKLEEKEHMMKIIEAENAVDNQENQDQRS